MGSNRLLELVSRRLAGEATAEELEEMKVILSEDPGASENWELLQQYWDKQEHSNTILADEAYSKIVSRLDLPVSARVVKMQVSRNNRFGRRVQVAVAVGIILIAGLFLFLNPAFLKGGLPGQHAGLIGKQNPQGIKRSFVLPDGSKIWLNADSKLQYPKHFNGNTRDVYLNGEAFFDVVKNPSKPFVIHLAHGTINVIGTSFNVRAYDNDEMVETSVATGKVAFIPKYRKEGKKQDTVVISPDNKVRYLKNYEELIVEPTVSKEDRAWIAGKLVFKGMTFEEIAMTLERNFGKKIVFVSDTARSFRLTGAFQDNSLEEIFFYLSKSKDFNYKITDAEVLISVE